MYVMRNIKYIIFIYIHILNAYVYSYIDLLQYESAKVLVNAKNKGNRTPLEVAWKKGDVETLKLLLRNGADYDVKDSQENTLLHWAAKSRLIDLFPGMSIAIKYIFL